jgi:hypothetical protein
LTTPREELPNEESIKELAALNLPSHYRLRSVRCSYGSECPPFIPKDFEIVIEFENHIDESLRGTDADVQTYQDWAFPLMQDIRADWPPDTVRISFIEKLPDAS